MHVLRGLIVSLLFLLLPLYTATGLPTGRTDHLGNITTIATVSGAAVAEYNYDAWGRLRNPATQTVYTEGQEPALFLGRGFCGHEHLPWFGLVNMNARLYDPLTGRFLSPDPYVQSPDFTQNFNRYSYCLNNPLKYTDESGEFVLTTAIIVGICVGTAIGAGAGAYQGYKIAEKKGLTGSEKTWTIIGGGLIGGVAGAASAFVGAYVAEGMAVGGFLAGAKVGGIAGATAGFINGFGMSTLETGNPLQGLNQGLYQATIGALSGALIGGLTQGISSAVKGNSFWNGQSFQQSNSIYDFEPDPNGVNQTLYRGTNGTERTSNSIFMTDSYDYAAEYAASKGGTVVKIKLPKITLDRMMYNGDLYINTGYYINGKTIPHTEYMFSPKVASSILTRLKF